MTECISQLQFGFLSRKQIVGRFDGGRVSSDGGAVLVAEADRRLGLTDQLAGCLNDPRQPAKVRQSLPDLLRQRIYQIALGYEDCNDADTLASDPLLKACIGRYPDSAPDLASQPTLSRFENAWDKKALYRLAQVFVQGFIQAHPKAPRQIVLDLDATDDPTHGQQELTFFHGYYDTYCYLPLLGFAQADDGPQELVAAVLRPGNVHAGHGTVAILKRLVAAFGEAWPKARIVLRGDSGLALPAVYDWCEDHDVTYVISLAKNPRLVALAEPFLQAARDEVARTGHKARHFHEVRYAADSWRHERRVILKAEVTPQGDNPRFVVTNDARRTPAELYHFYTQRGDVENRIKEVKLDLKADRTSCHRFLANQFRLLLHAAAFVLMSALRDGLHGTELAAAQACTIRLKLLKVGVRVRETARRVWLHLSSAYPLQPLWFLLLSRLRAPCT